MRILFWNTHKNLEINPILIDLINENNVSVVVLAEYESNSDELVALSEKSGRFMNSYFTVGCDRIKIFGTISDVEPSSQSKYASVQIINKKTILCCVHLPSQIFSANEGMRNIVINQIIEDLEKTETELKSENTIVVGDFNINPFDSTCTGASLFHGIPIYDEAKRKTRTIAGKMFKMFYNPMWNFLGDFKSPYGTYYYNGNSYDNTYWHIYDQVMIRPEIRDRFVDSSLKIVTRTKEINFLDNRGHPDVSISDHLPIIFEIKEK